MSQDEVAMVKQYFPQLNSPAPRPKHSSLGQTADDSGIFARDEDEILTVGTPSEHKPPLGHVDADG